MRFYLYEPGTLVKSAFGIEEPPKEETKEFSLRGEKPGKCLVIMPGLYFDEDGQRLGYGGGYYNRFLSDKPDIPTCAIGFSIPLRDRIPAEDWDIKPQRILVR